MKPIYEKDSISDKENTNRSVICQMYPKSLKDVCWENETIVFTRFSLSLLVDLESDVE